jgi:hypothetical protein
MGNIQIGTIDDFSDRMGVVSGIILVFSKLGK